MTRRAAAFAALCAPALLTGCDGGALDPQGRGASDIAGLWWLMFWLSVVVVAIVLVFLAMSLLRRDGERSPRSDRRIIFLGGVALPVAILVPVVWSTVDTSRAVAPVDDPALEVVVTGHQFWWDLEYPRPGSTRIAEGETFRTANEIHVPVGETVRLRLRSPDVIHSFWVPELDGKRDMMPGAENFLDVHVEEPGVYRGQCAELCGDGHALMRLLLIAEPREQFEAWLRRESADVAVQPADDVREEFANSCAPCHNLRGALEEPVFRGELGPDLTHLAARRMIGASILPNTREALGRWIVDPRGVKPGNRMPDVGLDGPELADMVDYLERLE